MFCIWQHLDKMRIGRERLDWQTYVGPNLAHVCHIVHPAC